MTEDERRALNRDSLEKITDITIQMPNNFSVRALKRTLLAYKDELEEEGKTEEEVTTLVHAEFIRLRREDNGS